MPLRYSNLKWFDCISFT